MPKLAVKVPHTNPTEQLRDALARAIDDVANTDWDGVPEDQMAIWTANMIIKRLNDAGVTVDWASVTPEPGPY